MLLHEKYVTKKETSTHFQSKDLAQSKIRFFLGNETSYSLDPYGCTRHKTRFMNSYYPVLMEEARGVFDNNGYIRS